MERGIFLEQVIEELSESGWSARLPATSSAWTSTAGCGGSGRWPRRSICAQYGGTLPPTRHDVLAALIPVSQLDPGDRPPWPSAAGVSPSSSKTTCAIRCCSSSCCRCRCATRVDNWDWPVDTELASLLTSLADHLRHCWQRYPRRRHDGPPPPDRGQSAPGGQRRQEVYRARHDHARPGAGRQHRPDPGGGEVPLHQGLQVLDLRDLVDSPGDHPRHRRPGAHDPHPRAYGRDDQPRGPRPAAHGQELGREPTSDELARDLGISAEKVREILKISQEPVSLETPIGEEEDSHLGDFIEDARRWPPPTPPATAC